MSERKLSSEASRYRWESHHSGYHAQKAICLYPSKVLFPSRFPRFVTKCCVPHVPPSRFPRFVTKCCVPHVLPVSLTFSLCPSRSPCVPHVLPVSLTFSLCPSRSPCFPRFPRFPRFLTKCCVPHVRSSLTLGRAGANRYLSHLVTERGQQFLGIPRGPQEPLALSTVMNLNSRCHLIASQRSAPVSARWVTQACANSQ